MKKKENGDAKEGEATEGDEGQSFSKDVKKIKTSER